MTDPVTSRTPQWLLPRDHAPPRGKTIQILVYTGVAVRGEWRNDAGFIAWAPLLKMTPEVKVELERYREIAASFRHKEKA